MWPMSQAYLLRGLPLNVNYAAGQILAEFFTFGFNSFFCYFFLNGSSTAEIRGLSNNELQGSVSLWAPAFPRKVACWVGGPVVLATLEAWSASGQMSRSKPPVCVLCTIAFMHPGLGSLIWAVRRSIS